MGGEPREAWGPPRNGEARARLRMEDWTCLGQHKRQPEFPVVTRESRRNSRKTTWLPRHRKMKPFPATAPQEKSHVNGTTGWFQIGKGVCQSCILSPCLFNLYAECIMINAVLEEAQAGIKTAGRNISNLRYADDTTLMAENEE